MSNALRRRLAALKEMRTDRGATPGEAAAAREAIERIQDRLRRAGKLTDALNGAEPYPGTQQGPPAKLRRRDKRPRPVQGIRIGDIIDATGVAPFTYCKCGGSRFSVEPGIERVAVALLVCCQCRRSRKLRREDFRT